MSSPNGPETQVPAGTSGGLGSCTDSWVQEQENLRSGECRSACRMTSTATSFRCCPEASVQLPRHRIGRRRHLCVNPTGAVGDVPRSRASFRRPGPADPIAELGQRAGAVVVCGRSETLEDADPGTDCGFPYLGTCGADNVEPASVGPHSSGRPGERGGSRPCGRQAKRQAGPRHRHDTRVPRRSPPHGSDRIATGGSSTSRWRHTRREAAYAT